MPDRKLLRLHTDDCVFWDERTSSRRCDCGTHRSIHISSKGCRLSYPGAKCRCPGAECWVTEQRQRQERGLVYESPEEWHVRIASPPLVAAPVPEMKFTEDLTSEENFASDFQKFVSGDDD